MNDAKGFMSAMKGMSSKGGMAAVAKDEQQKMEGGDDDAEMAFNDGCDAMMEAAKSGDKAAFRKAVKIAFMACDMLPHKEYEDSEAK